MEELVHVPIRLFQMVSRSVYEYNEETNEWVLVSRDEPVTEQFNKWAEENGVNPCQHTITMRSYKEGDRFVNETVLCVSVIGRKEQAMMELAYRQKVAELLSAAIGQDEAPSQELGSPQPQQEALKGIPTEIQGMEGGETEKITLPAKKIPLPPKD